MPAARKTVDVADDTQIPDLTIPVDKIGFIVEKAREFDAKEGTSDPDSGSNPTDDGSADILEDKPDDPTLSIGPIRIDHARYEVFVSDKPIHLTPIEFRLLALLARHAGKVLTHRQLLHDVWGPRDTHQTHYLRVHMAALRRKIEVDPARPRWLTTEAGVGYRLKDE